MLLSGGLDSAVLLMEEALRGEAQPVYVSVGLAWEKAERETIARFVEAAGLNGRMRPLVVLTVDMTDVYPTTHWAVQGRPPGYHTPDEDVYLPGRNVILLGKTAVFCAASGIGRIVIGTLDHNPFPDATPAFRAAMQGALSLGLGHELSIDAPYARGEQGERHPPGHRAWRAAGAHSVVHAAGEARWRFRALRPLQQVSRAPPGVRGGRSSRPDDLR